MGRFCISLLLNILIANSYGPHAASPSYTNNKLRWPEHTVIVLTKIANLIGERLISLPYFNMEKKNEMSKL